MSSIKGDWIKIRKCDACEQTSDYQYNAHYYGYDDSETYGSSYDDSYDSEDKAYDIDYESGPTWDSNSDPYSNDEPYDNQYSYGSTSSDSKELTPKKRHRRGWEDRHKQDENSCELPEQNHDLSKYNPYTVKYTHQSSQSTTATAIPTTTNRNTNSIPVLPTSQEPIDQPTINIGPELATTVELESTAEPTVAGIGSTAVIGIIAAIAISILGFVSYRFYNSKKSKNQLKSNPKQQSPEETKQLNDSKNDKVLVVTNVPKYNSQTTQITHISEESTNLS